MLDAINQRLFALYSRDPRTFRLYALVAGASVQEVTGSVPVHDAGSVALFDQTVDTAIADAGPWLLKIDQASAPNIALLQKLGETAIGLVWLISAREFADLKEDLTSRLDVALPDGSISLLRYYDPTCLLDLAQSLQPNQRAEFFAPAHEWLVYRDGSLTVVHAVETPPSDHG
ncbi:hypothetical protein WM40_04125 [Robbsia andropogonis]|uniref:DUF4123 domain-containing protein n=1 Tax=Robbsia andropogonis TaxID=28092 RepID=A0A0F5K515_9BURK|nr:DUF4123 domain-containing protein [Robbsia andropogonis]KKB64622.1 hypothetical protein WM40_04125 [Robbsia andropogonis]MCP1117788.1 DUF4123 domain-containing protein [Robbsia andropogonis]MCP1127253.1 DUF4123 domain-containing protein [Robbsia andropogonis]